MKIAAVRGDLNVKAGAAGAFIMMMRELAGLGHTVEIFLFSCEPEIERELRRDFEVRVEGFHGAGGPRLLPGLGAIAERVLVMPAALRISGAIARGDYDVVFADHYHLATMVLPRVETPSVFYCYEPPRRYHDPAIIRTDTPSNLKYLLNLPLYEIDKLTDRFLARRARAILTNSDFTTECVWRAYGRKAKTVRLGVDSAVHASVPGARRGDYVLTVGVIQGHKGHDFVVRSLGMVPPEHRPRLVIVSYDRNTRVASRLMEEARAAGVDVEVRDFVDDEEFARLHSSAMFVVLGFVMEPSLEPVAFAYGLPIVAVREGGVREVVQDGVTGILTDRDEREFAAAIERLVTNPEEVRRMGLRAREWVESDFTWSQCGENLEDALLEIAGLNRSGC